MSNKNKDKSFASKWELLKQESQHLIECPDKGEEIHRIFEKGSLYIESHGSQMFRLGFIMGAASLAILIGIATVVVVG